jgi:acetate---CoA ligase (ADP-forming)
VLRVESTQALFDAADLLERQPLPRGRCVGVVSNSGGLGVVAADACAARGLELASLGEATRSRLAAALPDADRLGNPVDLGVRAPVTDDVEAVGALFADERVDAVLVLHVELGDGDPLARLEALESVEASKPVVACVVGSGGELPRRSAWRVPNYRFPEAAVRALALAADRRDWLSRPLGQTLAVEGVDVDAARALAAGGGTGELDIGRAQELLRAAGIAPAAGSAVRMVADPDLGPLIGIGDEYRLVPLTDVDVQELAPDDAAARDVVTRLAALSEALPELVAIELDPLRVVLGPPPERQRAKTW